MSARSWTAPALWRFGDGREIDSGGSSRARTSGSGAKSDRRKTAIQDAAAAPTMRLLLPQTKLAENTVQQIVRRSLPNDLPNRAQRSPQFKRRQLQPNASL